MRRALAAFLLACCIGAPVMAVPLQNALAQAYPAPEFTGITGWLNTPPLSMAFLKGRVVLVDFWTYSCINCQRTLPHVIDWDRRYRAQGLVVVGVQSPEFESEKVRAHIESALAEHGITYPVAIDNQMATWNAYRNRYWPAFYLIDRDGQVVYTHFGEGAYDVMDANIHALLAALPSPQPSRKAMP